MKNAVILFLKSGRERTYIKQITNRKEPFGKAKISFTNDLRLAMVIPNSKRNSTWIALARPFIKGYLFEHQSLKQAVALTNQRIGYLPVKIYND